MRITVALMKGTAHFRFVQDVPPVSIATDGASSVQGEIEVLKVGPVYNAAGDLVADVTPEMLEALAQNFERAGRAVPLDFNHGSMKPGATAEEGKAAGWVRALVRIGGNVLRAVVDYTREAALAVKSGAYRFASAEFHLDFAKANTGEKIGPTLLAIALTNRPAVPGMEPARVALSEAVRLTVNEGVKTMKHFLKALGLAEDATEEQALAAIKALVEKAAQVTPADDAEKHMAAVAAIDAKVKALTDAHAADVAKRDGEIRHLTEKVAAMEQSGTDALAKARAARFEAMAKSGRALPAEKAFVLALSETQFAEWEKSRPTSLAFWQPIGVPGSATWGDEAMTPAEAMEKHDGDARAALTELATIRGRDKKLSFTAAFDEVSKEHVALTERANEQSRRGASNPGGNVRPFTGHRVS